MLSNNEVQFEAAQAPEEQSRLLGRIPRRFAVAGATVLSAFAFAETTAVASPITEAAPIVTRAYTPDTQPADDCTTNPDGTETCTSDSTTITGSTNTGSISVGASNTSPKPSNHVSSTSNNTSTSSLNHNYDSPLEYPNDCGQAAMEDAFSFALQKPISQKFIVEHDPDFYNAATGSHDDKNYAHYVEGAAKEEAKALGGVVIKVTNIYAGFAAVKTGDYSMIMVTAGSPGDPITEASHYTETDEVEGDAMVIHDSHQAKGRNLDKSLRTIAWMRKWGTLNWALLIKRKNS